MVGRITAGYEQTKALWQPRYANSLSEADLDEIGANVVAYLEYLIRWQDDAQRTGCEGPRPSTAAASDGRTLAAGPPAADAPKDAPRLESSDPF